MVNNSSDSDKQRGLVGKGFVMLSPSSLCMDTIGDLTICLRHFGSKQKKRTEVKVQRFNWSNLGHLLKSDIISFQILIIFQMPVSLHEMSLFPLFSESVKIL